MDKQSTVDNGYEQQLRIDERVHLSNVCNGNIELWFRYTYLNHFIVIVFFRIDIWFCLSSSVLCDRLKAKNWNKLLEMNRTQSLICALHPYNIIST